MASITPVSSSRLRRFGVVACGGFDQRDQSAAVGQRPDGGLDPALVRRAPLPDGRGSAVGGRQAGQHASGLRAGGGMIAGQIEQIGGTPADDRDPVPGIDDDDALFEMIQDHLDPRRIVVTTNARRLGGAVPLLKSRQDTRRNASPFPSCRHTETSLAFLSRSTTYRRTNIVAA
jgi:hypothetical protein